MTLAEFWAQAQRRLSDELSEQQFNLAIAPITVGEENGAWVIYAKNQFAINLLRSQYANKIAALHAELAPQSPEIAYKVGTGERIEMAQTSISGSLKTEQSTETQSIQDNKTVEEMPATVSRSKKTSAQDILAQRMNNLRPAKKQTKKPQRKPPNHAARLKKNASAKKPSNATRKPTFLPTTHLKHW